MFDHEPTLEELTRAYLEHLLVKYEHNRRKIAVVLGVNHNTVYNMLNRFGLADGPKRQGYRSDLRKAQ